MNMAWLNFRRRKKIPVVKILFLFFITYALLVTARHVQKSTVFSPPDRINIIFYGQNPSLISLGLEDDVDYLANFENDVEFLVPGGYGYYKVGAIGKLADIEDKPDLIAKSFSWGTSTYMHYYFYPSSPTVYRPVQSVDESGQAMMPDLSFFDSLFARGLKSNAGLVDRIYIWYLLSTRSKKDFFVIATNYITEAVDNPSQAIFDKIAFNKKYQGFFYQNSLREEGAEVRLVYNKASAALILSSILEGQGIRVVDLAAWDQRDGKTLKKCRFYVSQDEKFEATADFIEQTFECSRTNRKNEDVDLEVVLGDNIESIWEGR